MCVLVVNLVVGFSALIEFVVFAQTPVIGYSRVKRFAGRQRSFELCPFLGSLCLAEREGTAVEVIPSLAGLPSLENQEVSKVVWRPADLGVPYYHVGRPYGVSCYLRQTLTSSSSSCRGDGGI